METRQVLLVDDEADFRAVLKRRLQKRGFSVLEADSGRGCRSVFEERPADAPVDVVVLDVKMPETSGIEVLEWIKASHPGTEVILLTGHASAADGVEGIKKGAFDYLTKPVELDHLVRKINQAVSNREALAFKAKIDRQMADTERLASLGTLSAGIAHEIDNPLATIREASAYMRLLLEKAAPEEMPRKKDFENAVAKIETGVARARRITHQLLGFVKQQPSLMVPTDLRELVAETVGLAQKEAWKQGIRIVQETGEADGTIQSDPHAIRQVLVNLLTNAIHAAGEGGLVTVSLAPAGPAVVLSVKDTGGGIPEEYLKKIFLPFFTTKPPDRGTGLGLYVTAGIIKRLHGSIEIDSRPGEGACFRVTLPRSAAGSRGPDAPESAGQDIL